MSDVRPALALNSAVISDFSLYTLPNGLRVVHKHVAATALGHCAFFIPVGSRHELPAEYGMAHFLEHMLFKGTHKRKSFHILNRLDSVGGDLNAYTTKEITCLHASFLDEYLGRATELLADVAFGANFPEKEIDKERTVIREEIAGYKDDPQESLLDDFEELMFAGHPLAHNILGTEDALSAFTQPMVQGFHTRHYRPEAMVFSYVGPLGLAAFRREVDRFLGRHGPEKQAEIPLLSDVLPTFQLPPAQHKVEATPHSQTYVVTGCLAPSRRDPKNYAMWLLNNILGGDAMNSRLNLNIRERYGMVYSIESMYTSYADVGLWGVLYSTDKTQSKRVLSLVERELKSLIDKPLGTAQLTQAKRQMMTRLLMAEESRSSLMQALGRAYLQDGKILTLKELLTKIEAVTATEIQEMAREVFAPERRLTLEFRGEGE